MQIETAVKEYLVEIEVRKFTPKTIRSYRNNLNLFLRYCKEIGEVDEIEELTLAVVRKFSLFMVEKGKKGSYINSLLFYNCSCPFFRTQYYFLWSAD